MSSRVSDRSAAVVVPKSKVDAEPQVSTPVPSPSRPAGWSAPTDKVNDGWKKGTAPRPSIAPPPAPLVSDAPTFSARALAAAQPPPSSGMTRVLKPGVSGGDVQQLQTRLKELGFEVSPTGSYDSRTERAVESFQRSQGLKVDGDAGRNTLRALGFTYGARATTSTDTGSHTIGSRTLKRGMAGDDVRALQQRLRDNGQSVRVTGSYDAATERAVETFQRAHDLNVDGDAGRNTLTALGFTFGQPRGQVTDGPAQIVTPRSTVTPRADVTPRSTVTPSTDVTPRADVTHVHTPGEPHVHDTPRTDTPARPATIASNAAFGDVREREAIAARITVGRGTHTNEADIAAVRAEVAKLPLDQLRDLQRAGVKVVACRDNVTDAVPSLRDVQPRGWAPGRTWNDVPGAYNPNSKEVIVATRGGAGGAREVPPIGNGHGSVSLVAHEVAHAVDASRRYPSKNDDTFQRAYQQDLRGGQLLPYYTQAGEAGASEAYAESLAIYLSGDPNGDGARRFPALMSYWQQQYRPENAS